MKSVLITGGAAGIGRATAQKFADEGWLVGIFDVDSVGVQRALDEIGESAIGGHLDVTDAEEWNEALAVFTAATGGTLDLLVNNAGILRGGRFAEQDLVRDHHLTIDINVKGVINGCYAAYPYLLATEGSGVINLCSASAIYGQAELATYSASKFAVRGLTEALELEWRKEGIRVQAVWPLFVDTAMTQDLKIGSTDTLGVNLTPADVADTIFAMAQERGLLGKVLPAKVHTAVGLPAKAMALASDLVPSFLSREVNKRITHS